MRRLIIDGPHAVRLETAAAAPLPGPDEVLVRVEAAGVCGSDVHGYVGANDRRPPGTVMGHEGGGIVVGAGDAVAADLLGLRVAINPVVWCGECPPCVRGATNRCATRRLYGCTPELPGTFAEHIVVRAVNAVALAAGTSPARAALVEPLSVGEHAFRRADVQAGERALVIGGGPIGIAAALAAGRRGIEVVVSEPDPERRSLLGELGLRPVDPGTVVAASADVALECVGFPQTIDAALAGVRPGGRIVLVGLADARPPFDAAAVVMGERDLLGSAVYTPGEFADVAAWVSETDVPLESIVQAEVGLEGLADLFAAHAEGRQRAVKTLVRISS